MHANIQVVNIETKGDLQLLLRAALRPAKYDHSAIKCFFYNF